MTKADPELVQLLSNVPLFASLNPRELGSLALAGKPHSYAAGAKVVSVGEVGVGFYLILTGRVEVHAGGKTVATLNAGNFFGEMALFHEQPRTADVVAAEPTTCLVLSSWEFWGVLSDKPEAMRELITELVKRLRATKAALSE
ncbi:MAG TPA: cyclic nucleotide-binding domain-containing protein [Thermoplasmata archaeon]|nr:cyclic nucleotide-binding domain-containing protein [Thermoplasmata archaeon]